MKAVKAGENVFRIFCLGCNDFHTIHVNGHRNASGASWSFDLNLDSPTFSPSINLRTGVYADPTWQGKGSIICHFYIKEGRIRYMSDCTHDLKGQTIDLPDL